LKTRRHVFDKQAKVLIAEFLEREYQAKTNITTNHTNTNIVRRSKITTTRLIKNGSKYKSNKTKVSHNTLNLLGHH